MLYKWMIYPTTSHSTMRVNDDVTAMQRIVDQLEDAIVAYIKDRYRSMDRRVFDALTDSTLIVQHLHLLPDIVMLYWYSLLLHNNGSCTDTCNSGRCATAFYNRIIDRLAERIFENNDDDDDDYDDDDADDMI